MRVVDCLYIHTDGGSTGVEGTAWMAAIGIGLNYVCGCIYVCANACVCVCACVSIDVVI